MSSTVNSASFTFSYEDSTERTYTIDDISSEARADLKDNIESVNANANHEFDELYASFISNSGASFVKISSAKAVNVVEEVLYNG